MEKHTVAVDLFLSFVAIYSPVIVPGDDNGTIYLEEKLNLQSYAMKGEVSPGRGFSSGALHAENGARRCFGEVS